MSKIFVVGHPSEYGGAGSELYHQILLWRIHMDLDVTIIPSMEGFKNEPLYKEMLRIGVKYTDTHRCYDDVTEKDIVLNFCGKEFLDDLVRINQKTKKVVFINCMTWLFKKERLAHRDNLIGYSLYQRQGVLDDHEAELRNTFKSQAEFIQFDPYFHPSMVGGEDMREADKFTLGRISRQDADKFSTDTFHIWETSVAPIWKRGIVLGWDARSRQKTGHPPHWVECHLNHNTFPISDFYSSIDVLVQSTDTTENLPRIGFEAMHAGVVLVVDDRGGWQNMIEHGVTGFLCKTQQEFIYWTSRLAFEPELRLKVAKEAKKRVEMKSGVEAAKQSWEYVFSEILEPALV